jgi:hypothetical protein
MRYLVDLILGSAVNATPVISKDSSKVARIEKIPIPIMQRTLFNEYRNKNFGEQGSTMKLLSLMFA